MKTKFSRRMSALAAVAVVSLFGILLTVSDANAYSCVRGVYRAGCAGPNGAVVTGRPAARACRSVLVNGVYVRRCT